ncbi:hypothetical protein D3C84_1003980 [compost metagenome]
MLVEFPDFADVGEAQRASALVCRGGQVFDLGLREILVHVFAEFNFALVRDLFRYGNAALTTSVFGGAKA